MQIDLEQNKLGVCLNGYYQEDEGNLSQGRETALLIHMYCL